VSAAISADDRFAINDLMMAYAKASDTGHVQGFVDVFAPDAVLYGSNGELYAGHDGIRRFAIEQCSPADARGRMHFFQQMTITREGERCRVFSFWMVVQSTVKDNVKRLRSTGSCDDLVEKASGRWLFRERRIARWNDETAPWLYSP
jgi:uncharacterized protein (TIGR02246 family)